MPTEHDYERAADEFRALARQLDDQATWAPHAPAAGFVTSAPIAAEVDRAQRAAIGRIVEAAGEVRRIAEICDARANVCREHRRAVRAYESIPLEIRVHRTPPVEPARWVEL